MFIMHIALGGCIKAPPITYGITSDTGGHITYLMGAAMAQVENPAIDRVEVITRLFRDHTLGEVYAQPRERFAPKGEIVRLETKRDSYLSKEELIADIPAITEAFLDYLRTLDRLPDVIHAHFADAFVLANAALARFHRTSEAALIGRGERVPDVFAFEPARYRTLFVARGDPITPCSRLAAAVRGTGFAKAALRTVALPFAGIARTAARAPSTVGHR